MFHVLIVEAPQRPFLKRPLRPTGRGFLLFFPARTQRQALWCRNKAECHTLGLALDIRAPLNPPLQPPLPSFNLQFAALRVFRPACVCVCSRISFVFDDLQKLLKQRPEEAGPSKPHFSWNTQAPSDPHKRLRRHERRHLGKIYKHKVRLNTPVTIYRPNKARTKRRFHNT